MSNEHLSQVGRSTVDQAVDGNGSDIDDGPLDPSVFFGLFDDLGDDTDSEPAVDLAPRESELDEVRAGESDGFMVDDILVDEVMVDEITVDEITADEPPTDQPGPDRVVLGELEPDELEPDEIVLGELVLDEPSPDVLVLDEPVADDLLLDGFPLDTPVDEESDADASGPATVSWWTTAPEEQPVNGGRISVASPPPIPPSTKEASPALESVAVGPDEASHVAAQHLAIEADDVGDPLGRTPLSVEDPRDPGGTLAKATLAVIAVSLFAGLVVAFVLSLRSPDPALSGSVAGASNGGDPAASTAVEEPPAGLAGAVATGEPPTAELLEEEFSTALTAALLNRADLTSLRFEPGTAELDPRSALVVDEVGALLSEDPAVPVTISVRTYTEQTPADNLALSIDQAQSLTSSLVAAGATPEQIRARGIGGAPLSQAQPVPNFVVLTAPFGDHRLDEALDGLSPFALGVPATPSDGAWTLRPDGLLAVGEPAGMLSAYPDVRIGAAGYSYLPPSESSIRSEAEAAVAGLTDFLVTAYGADQQQISTIIPGSAVFVPTAEHGNHVWLQIGPASQGAFDVASIDPAAITFAPGTAELDASGLVAVQALADALNDGGATIVVDVRSYESADAAADQALSEARSDALAEALTVAGVAPEQLRMHASGASSYQAEDGGPAITITVAP